MKTIPEYDLHPSGARLGDAVVILDRIVSRERARHGLFVVVESSSVPHLLVLVV